MDDLRIYYNFIRPHMALNGKTPAEACGITVEGKNKWTTLIQNSASKYISLNTEKRSRVLTDSQIIE